MSTNHTNHTNERRSGEPVADPAHPRLTINPFVWFVWFVGNKKGGASRRRPSGRTAGYAACSLSICGADGAAAISIRRGFSASGISRFREIESRPASSLASVTTT